MTAMGRDMERDGGRTSFPFVGIWREKKRQADWRMHKEMEAMNAAATAQHQQPHRKKSSHIGDGIDVTMIRRFISLLEFVWRRRLLLHLPAAFMPLAATCHVRQQ